MIWREKLFQRSVSKKDEVHREVHLERSRKKDIKSLRIRAKIATKKFVNSIPRFNLLNSIYSHRAKEAANKFLKSVPKSNFQEELENRVNEENLNLGMIDVPPSALLHGHDTSKKILKAVMLFWENSGRGNYGNLSNALVNDGLNSEATSFSSMMISLQKELKGEKLTINDQSNIIRKFNQKIGNKKPLIACASCGERNYNNIWKEVCIHKELEILKLSASQIEEWNRLGSYKAIATVTNVNNILYYIHPECVTSRDGTYYTNICKVCSDDMARKVIPTFSIANGHDYGDYKRMSTLLPLTVVEKHLISRNRIYGSIVKIKEGGNRQLIGNIITFEHDGPEKCAEKFDFPDVKGILKTLKVAFVGTRNQYEKYRKDVIMTCGELQVRTENIYNWLKMLRHCNPKYWNITINESEECLTRVNNVTNRLIENIEIMDTENAVNIERVISSDTANVREVKYEKSTSGNLYTIPMSSTFLYNENTGRSALELKMKALKGLGNTILPNVIQVARSEIPLNEFENNSQIFLGSFPNLFLFGTFGNGVSIKGTLPNKYIRHLLNQR
jgi:hypothetical protein